MWAAVAVVLLTLLNIAGTMQSKTLQKVMEIVLIAGLVLFSIAALLGGGQAAAGGGSLASFGFAMIFVLLAGGWNEAAYLAGEVRDARRNMTRVLVGGVLIVAALYLLVNLAYLAVLGHGGIESRKRAADVMRAIAGERAAVLLALLVCVSVLTMNAAIFTGARTTYAMGRTGLFEKLGAWRSAAAPRPMRLCCRGNHARPRRSFGCHADGFSAMVAYTSPVFWTFFLLTGLTLFMFRRRAENIPCSACRCTPSCRRFRADVRLHALFEHRLRAQPGLRPEVRLRVFAGLVVMAAGIPLYFLSKKMTLTELRYIVAVARERHFGRAAETCFVSQPTLSVAVKSSRTSSG